MITLKQVIDLLNQTHLLIENTDTVEWDPSVGQEYAGQGGHNKPTSSPSNTRSEQNKAITPRKATGRVTKGDIVMVKSNVGKQTPTVIASVESGNVSVINTKQDIKKIVSQGSLVPVDQATAKYFAQRYPDRNVWMINDNMQVPL